MRGVFVRTIAAFVLATLGGFIGVYVGLAVGVVIDTVSGTPLGRAPSAVPAGTDAWLAIGVAGVFLCAGAALFSLAPNVLGGAGARPFRAVAGALVGTLLFLLVRDGAWLHAALLLVPMGAALGASITRPDVVSPR